MIKRLAVSFALLIALTGFDVQQANAQDPMGADDLLFLQRAAKNGFLEVRIGKLALEHSQTQAVKDLAQKMIDDHTRANKELDALAHTKGVSIPQDDGAGILNLAMAKASGKEFDSLFRKEVIEDHEKDVTMFELQLKTGSDKDLQTWASKTLASMKQHLADAKSLPELP